MNKFVSVIKNAYGRMALSVSMLLFSVICFAQDKKEVDININTKSDNGFFANPIVWVIGGAVFILLLVALLRNNSSKTA